MYPFLDFRRLRLRGLPNEYLVAAKAATPKAPPHEEAPVFAAPVERLAAAFAEVLAGEPRLSLLAADPAEHRYEAVVRSRLFRFPDRLSVRLLPAGDARSTLAVYSRAVYGVWDVGVNRRRVRRLLRRLASALAVGVGE